MAIIDSREKNLDREKIVLLKRSSTFCLDCMIDWCKMRNQVTYCSQKYKGTSCYNCEDGKCSIKKLASS